MCNKCNNINCAGLCGEYHSSPRCNEPKCGNCHSHTCTGCHGHSHEHSHKCCGMYQGVSLSCGSLVINKGDKYDDVIKKLFEAVCVLNTLKINQDEITCYASAVYGKIKIVNQRGVKSYFKGLVVGGPMTIVSNPLEIKDIENRILNDPNFILIEC